MENSIQERILNIMLKDQECRNAILQEDWITALGRATEISEWAFGYTPLTTYSALFYILKEINYDSGIHPSSIYTIKDIQKNNLGFNKLSNYCIVNSDHGWIPICVLDEASEEIFVHDYNLSHDYPVSGYFIFCDKENYIILPTNKEDIYLVLTNDQL